MMYNKRVFGHQPDTLFQKEGTMEITITLRGTLKKLFGPDKERKIEVPDHCTCDEALRAAGINYKEIPNFGFVAVNGMRVMIDDKLSPGDELKAWSRISGG